jgi:hypothetical protein
MHPALGLMDPLDVISQVQADDPLADARGNLLAYLAEQDWTQDEGFDSAKVSKLASSGFCGRLEALLGEATGSDPTLSARSVGRILAGMEGEPLRGLVLRSTLCRGAKVWRIEAVGVDQALLRDCA